MIEHLQNHWQEYSLMVLIAAVGLLFFWVTSSSPERCRSFKEIPCEKFVTSNNVPSYTYKSFCIVCEEVKVRE
jgi:hypothetical protein